MTRTMHLMIIDIHMDGFIHATQVVTVREGRAGTRRFDTSDFEIDSWPTRQVWSRHKVSLHQIFQNILIRSF